MPIIRRNLDDVGAIPERRATNWINIARRTSNFPTRISIVGQTLLLVGREEKRTLTRLANARRIAGSDQDSRFWTSSPVGPCAVKEPFESANDRATGGNASSPDDYLVPFRFKSVRRSPLYR